MKQEGSTFIFLGGGILANIVHSLTLSQIALIAQIVAYTLAAIQALLMIRKITKKK